MSANTSRGAGRMLMRFVRAYPGRSTITLLCLLLAGLMDGLGLSTLLSMISVATEGGISDEPSLPEQMALTFTGYLGLAPTAGNLLGIAIVVISLKAVLTLLAKRQVGYTVAHVATDLRLALIRAIMTSRWRYYLSQPVGSLSNAVATEAQRASEGFLYGATMASLILNAAVYIAVAFLVSWRATLLAMLAGLGLLLVLNLLVRVARRAGERQTVLLKSLLTAMTDQLTSVKPLKAMAREEHVDSMLSGQTEQLNRVLRRQVFSKEALIALQEPMLAILIGVGFFLALDSMNLSLAAVLVLVFALARAMTFLSKAQRQYQHMAICESAFWSLQDAIDHARAQQEPPRGSKAPELEREIRFEAVSFAHGARQILHRQSLCIPARRLTVITGPSGAGKTTIMDLVVGLLHPDDGVIRVDGVPLTEIDHRRWRQRIGYVPQEPLLLNDSIRRNITLGETHDDEAVIAALQSAGAWDFVAALPEGLDTLAGERGGRLSGGQRQRIAIARALVHQPQLLILDEATSSLDAVTEQAILATVRRLRDQFTLLAVSHQPALVEIADQVYTLDNGRLSEAAGPMHA